MGSGTRSDSPGAIRDDASVFGGSMQNIVIDKPYQFVPPHRGGFWPALFRPLIRPYLSKAWGVTKVEFVGVEALRTAIRDGASVVLVPNHCRPSDPMVVSLLGFESGTPSYTMASWHLFMGDRLTACPRADFSATARPRSRPSFREFSNASAAAPKAGGPGWRS